VADSFTVLWTSDHCNAIRRGVPRDARLDVLFGGPHQSAPSFVRYGVREGDLVYPVRVLKGELFLVSRMRVARIITVREYLLEHLGVDYPNEPHRIPSRYVDEAVIGAEGEPIRFDRRFPGERLEHLRFVSKKSERGLKYIENGLLKRAISLQGGVYRLAPQSADEFAALFA